MKSKVPLYRKSSLNPSIERDNTVNCDPQIQQGEFIYIVHGLGASSRTARCRLQQRLFEIKDTHRPWGGPVLLGIDLP